MDEKYCKVIEHKIETNELKRIGGWLIIPAIGLVTAPIIGAITLVSSWLILQTLPELTTNQIGLLWLSAYIDIAMIVAMIAVSIIFFQKYGIAIKCCVGFFIASIVVGFIQATLGFLMFKKIDAEIIKIILGPCIYGAIFIPYFLKSKRVKNTFTKPFNIHYRWKKYIFILLVFLIVTPLFFFLKPQKTVDDCILNHAVKAKSKLATNIINYACRDLHQGSYLNKKIAQCQIKHVLKANNDVAIHRARESCRDKYKNL